MSNIKAIRTETDYKAALSRIDALMHAEPGTPAGDELDVLVDLVEHYEEKHEPLGFPSAIAAIRFRMEQANLTPRDLVPFIGSRAKVSEVLSGKRPLTMPIGKCSTNTSAFRLMCSFGSLVSKRVIPSKASSGSGSPLRRC